MTWADIDVKLKEANLTEEQIKVVGEIINRVVDQLHSDIYWADYDFGD